MVQATVFDLQTAMPHEPPDSRLTAAEFAIYRAGYEHALAVTAKAITAAGKRYELIERSKRLAAKQKRAK